ncbi:MAG: hypothetical protein KC475_01985 [Cyanobacteria bacterium HKST-UBA03]|nr:hypothetical protein [Cyanobacteria bacterium HKST-UBA03]
MSFNDPNPTRLNVEENAVSIGTGDTLNFEEGSNIAFSVSKNGAVITVHTEATGSASGEANTASNAGLSGVGLVESKVGIDLPFRAIDTAHSAVTLTHNPTNKTVDVGLDESQVDHTALANVGTNTHAQLDSHVTTASAHLADAALHRSINDTGTAATDLWSADKITTELAAKANTSHTHTLANITDSGALAALDTIATAQIDDDAVTFDKVQNIASGVLAGRHTAGSGSLEAIGIGTHLGLSGGNLNVTLPSADDTTAGVLETATATEQQSATATDKIVTPARQQQHPSAAKAWISFTGTGTITINEDYGVASITDNGTGHYTITFDTAFAATTYAMAGQAYISANGLGTVFATSKATGSCTVKTWNESSYADANTVDCVFFGAQ